MKDNDNIDITDFKQLPPKIRPPQNQRKRNFAATMDNYTIVGPKPKKACEIIQPSDQCAHDESNPEPTQRDLRSVPARTEADASLPQHAEDRHCDFTYESASLDHIQGFSIGSDIAERSDFELYREDTVNDKLGVDEIAPDEQSEYFGLLGDEAVNCVTSPSAKKALPYWPPYALTSAPLSSSSLTASAWPRADAA